MEHFDEEFELLAADKLALQTLVDMQERPEHVDTLVQVVDCRLVRQRPHTVIEHIVRGRIVVDR